MFFVRHGALNSPVIFLPTIPPSTVNGKPTKKHKQIAMRNGRQANRQTDNTDNRYRSSDNTEQTDMSFNYQLAR
jgi:hypothetical protein